MKLLSRLLKIWIGWIVSQPRLVLAIAFLTAAASVVLTVTRLEMVTDQLELISENHPLIALSDKLDPFETDAKRRFDVVIEAPTPSRAVSFVAALSSVVAEDTAHFQGMYYRVDPGLFKSWQLLYLDEQEIAEVGAKLDAHSGLLRQFAERPDLLNFLGLLNREMASRLVEELFTASLDKDEPAKDGREPFDLSFLIDTLQGLSDHLHRQTGFKSPWASLLRGSAWDPDLEGYFWEAGKRYLIAFVTPRKSEGEIIVTQDSLERLRKHLRNLQVSYPDVKAGVTGQEALNDDEIHTVLEDMSVATWLSILGVFILLVLFRRGLRRPLLQTISLAVGLCWSFGWTTIFIGHLNVISVVFAPLLCGLGVDPGIHWFSRLEEEERDGRLDIKTVIRTVTDRSGPGIILAGFGTALSFLPFLLTGFRGLMELGAITGMGFLLSLLADFSVLPALTVLVGGHPTRESTFESALMRNDLVRFSPGNACMVLSGAVVLSILCILGASRVYFDLNPLRLQTANAESVLWGKALIENSHRSTLFANSLASSGEELHSKEKAFKALPSVSDVESIFSLLPENQEAKIPLLRSLRPKIPEIHSAVPESRPSDLQELSDILKRIGFKLQDDQAERWGAEKPLLEQMVRARALARDITESLQSVPNAPERLSEYRKLFLDDLKAKWDTLRLGANASLMQVEDLPDTLRGWFYRDGTYLMRIFPKKSAWEEHTLSEFVRELQAVDAEVVGNPISLFVFALAFKNACIKASLYAVVFISILLGLTFRSMRLTLFALVPLALGSLWTVGIMGVADIQFNLANSMFMPLVLGAGMEYAVIILSRWQEGRMLPGHIPFSTGKGVILAALTTTFGFGAIMISHHRGIFSLGFLAWAGSLCVLLSALFVLPALLARMDPPKVTSGG